MKKDNNNLNNFAYLKRKTHSGENYFLTIFDDSGMHTFNISELNKKLITFGSSPDSDIVLNSDNVDFDQGYFELTDFGLLAVNTSKNFPIVGNNNKFFDDLYLSEGGFIKIINPNLPTVQGVVIIMSIAKNLDEWKQFSLQFGGTTIGSAGYSDIILPPAGVSKHHATICCSRNKIVIRDECSMNGVYVNGQKIPSSR